MFDIEQIKLIKENKKYLFSIYTPTYNRGVYLNRIYNALCNQTLKDFEWLIIDDASTDDTESIAKSLISNKILDIKFFRHSKNIGKHNASKLAQSKANGFFFLNLDSDDIPKADALEKLYNAYDKIPDDEKSNFSAVTGLCVFADNTVIGDKFPKDLFDSTPLDILFKYNITGDKWGFQKTSILKQYSFNFYEDKDAIKNIKYYPEITVFGEIGRKYKTRYINEPLKIVEYRKDGISKSKIIHAVPKKLSALYKLKFCIDYLKYSPKEFFIAAILYTRWSLHSELFRLSELGNFKAKFLVILLYPVGLALYMIDKYKY